MTRTGKAHGALGSIYLSQGQYGQALAEVERAVILDPNDALELCGSG